MPKKHKKRKGVNGPRQSAPPKAVRELAKNYKCSHCNSRVEGIFRDSRGMQHLHIAHDATCPVLRGTITDVHDAIRAAIAAGRVARVIPGDANGGAA